MHDNKGNFHNFYRGKWDQKRNCNGSQDNRKASTLRGLHSLRQRNKITGALKKLQEILGIYILPVTKENIFNSISESGEFCKRTLERIEKDRPVVFIGPYEHYTNELMWRDPTL